MMWHGYFGIENLGLNATQRGVLVDAFKARLGATWEESRIEVLAYLAANRAAWEA